VAVGIQSQRVIFSGYMCENDQCGVIMENVKNFSVEELGQFDGKNGNPAYVAFKGKVYDVTDSYIWIDGDHSGEHQAGKDLTEQMTVAPHAEDVMERMKVVGVLSTV